MTVITRILAVLGAVTLGLGAWLFLLLQGLLCFDTCPSNVTLTEIQFAVETLGLGILLATGAWLLVRFAVSDRGDIVWRRRLNAALVAAIVAFVIAIVAPSLAIATHRYGSPALAIILVAGIVLVAWPLVTLIASFQIAARTAKSDAAAEDGMPPAAGSSSV